MQQFIPFEDDWDALESLRPARPDSLPGRLLPEPVVASHVNRPQRTGEGASACLRTADRFDGQS